MFDPLLEQFFDLCCAYQICFDALVYLLRCNPWAPKLRRRSWMYVPSDFFFMMFTMLIFSSIGLFSKYHLYSYSYAGTYASSLP